MFNLPTGNILVGLIIFFSILLFSFRIMVALNARKFFPFLFLVHLSLYFHLALRMTVIRLMTNPFHWHKFLSGIQQMVLSCSLSKAVMQRLQEKNFQLTRLVFK